MTVSGGDGKPEQSAFRVAHNFHYRMNDLVNGMTMAGQFHSHLIHQKRHVVIDDFDDRMIA